MDAPPHLSSHRERGVALIIVLAFVVLLTGLVVAYLSRTTSDRQVAHASFNQTKVDQAAATAMDLIIGGLRQEITGPSPTPTPPYLPATAANMLPVRFGNPPGSPDPIPNLVRISVRSDNTIPAPGVPSFASALNSTTDVSANGRFITSTRWNSHYLVPKGDTATTDSSPIPAFTNATPDWVIITRTPRDPTDPTSPYPVAFSAWDPILKDQTPTNNLYAVGRYAYAIYDEGGLLDANVAGYPSFTPTDSAGRKGPVAFADLTTLPYPIPTSPQVDRLVGWRNYGSIQPPATGFGPLPTFTFTTALATNYVNNFVVFNTTGFTTVQAGNALVANLTANGQTDQVFSNRKELIAFQKTTGFSANALQYLGTFLRELNAPSWKPSTPTTPTVSSIDYATLANTPTASTSTAVNRDLLYVRVGVPVGSTFTRADGTTAAVGDLLIKQRFPLSRINGLGPTGANTTTNSTIIRGVFQPATTTSDAKYPELPVGGTIQRDFGLQWDGTNYRWNYVGPTGSTVLSAIKTLDQVVADGREPNFFELLKAGILSGSMGIGSGGANTFVTADAKYLSSDYQIMQIGANIINQWNSGNVPIFFYFGSPANEIAGIKNLPYLNKLVFKPYWSAAKTAGQYQFDAWLLPSLWNPHQNAPPASQNVRIVMTAGTFSATTSSPAVTMTSITGGATQYMTIDANSFGAVGNPSTNNPSAPKAVVDKPNPPCTCTQSSDVTAPAGGYYGFHVNSTANTTTVPSASTTAQPNITGCIFQLQVDVTGKGNWKAYQTWTGCANTTPLKCAPTGLAGVNTYQDPEFVTLDPRTLRFGVWGNAANLSGAPADYTTGVLTTLETPAGVYETIPTAITDLRPHGTMFASATSPNLYLYANNTDGTVHYTDSNTTGGDTLQRRGDIISSSSTAMLPTDFVDRPQILNRPFQSMAELGQVFRDEPWKTLDFFMTTASPDAGLLDIFTLHEASMEAGKTSFNTRQTPVLTAILSGASKRLALADATTKISSTQRDSIVTALVGLQPMVRKTDLLTGLAGNATVTGLGSKEARDLVIRAFSDAGQTRTWNLMIDVVAQSGRYPPNASTLAGFLVEGEQHYWVHVAIDRLTGQVIDKQIEVVNE